MIFYLENPLAFSVECLPARSFGFLSDLTARWESEHCTDETLMRKQIFWERVASWYLFSVLRTKVVKWKEKGITARFGSLKCRRVDKGYISSGNITIISSPKLCLMWRSVCGLLEVASYCYIKYTDIRIMFTKGVTIHRESSSHRHFYQNQLEFAKSQEMLMIALNNCASRSKNVHEPNARSPFDRKRCKHAEISTRNMNRPA